MPFDPKRGAAFVDDVKKYMQWQSNADVLSNPPTSYLSPPVDIWGGLDYLQQQAADNKFGNQFEFDTALSDLFISAKDGHLSLIPCSYMPFAFVGHESLVSVSSDGLQLPQIYTFGDAEVLKSNPNAVSPIVTINGKEVVSQLQGVSESQLFQDPDARYNNVFLSRSRYTNSDLMAGAFSIGPNGMWPGSTVYNIAYANGTTSKSEVNAIVRKDEFQFVDGEALYESYCLPASDTTTTSSPSTATPTPSKSAPASSTPASQTPSSTAKPAPTGYPKAAIRDDNNLISGYLLSEPGLEDTAVLSVPTFSVSETPSQNYTFKSLEEFYGPHNVLGAKMTTANSLNLDLISNEEKPIHGFGDVKPEWTTPPFAPEDILIITDGACSSSCPIFTEMMKYEGVKTISFGGRPQYGPMQAMGGTRGAQVMPAETLMTITTAVLEMAAEEELLSESELQQLEALSPAEESPLQYGSLQVNFRDGYSKLDKDSVMPLQFVYEPAHCRLFYTLENVLQPATAWSAAVKAMWGSGHCVAGSRM
uniref:CPAF-like PDZ domain-containing protein n=1 Tax=Penicillium chrysogenum TaxID=5076 RepID=Q3HUS3_PENCH|nr:hypothetical protein [Penicillium chrysogenum]